MRLKYFLLLSLLFPAAVLNAQTDFKPGYVITLTGDTLVGEIDYRGDLLMSELCKFKTADDKVLAYTPYDIDAYRFHDSKFYVSRQVEDKRVFLEYLVNGEVNIYYYRDSGGDHYYIDKADEKLREIPYEEGIKQIGNARYSYKSSRHLHILKHYMTDAPALHKSIESIRKPDHRNLIDVAVNYHNAVCLDEACIVYEKPLPFIRIMPELVGGTTNYKTSDAINDGHIFTSGILGHIWLPRVNEKVFLRTGFLLFQVQTESFKYMQRKIPLQLEYIFPRALVRPRIAYGLNLYQAELPTVSCNFGVNLRITEMLFLSATSDIEFSTGAFYLTPGDFMANSFQVGILVDFNK